MNRHFMTQRIATMKIRKDEIEAKAEADDRSQHGGYSGV